MTDYVAMDDDMGCTASKKKTLTIKRFDHADCPGKSNQDLAKQGFVKSRGGIDLPYIAVADGHGGNKVIDCLRSPSLSWDWLMDTQEPTALLSARVAECGDTFKSGACLAFARVREIDGHLTLECEWLGDCTIFVVRDGTPYWQSRVHTCDDESEAARVKRLGFGSNTGYALSLMDNVDDITLEHCRYTVWAHRGFVQDMTDPTRCLGHNGIPSQQPSRHRIPLHTGSSWRVVCMTDGITDMFRSGELDQLASPSQPSRQLVDLATERWGASYRYVHPADCPCAACNPAPPAPRRRTVEEIKQPIEGGSDDITCVTMEFSTQ